MLTLSETLTIGRLKEARVLAGKSGLNREVTGTTIMDIPDIAAWLSGKELVIAGVLFQQCFSRELVEKLLEKNVAGIVTKEKFITTINPELFSYCDEIGFPIILAPSDCSWGQITNPIMSHISSRPYLIIEETQKFHNALMKSVIDGVSLSELCEKIYEMANLKIAIMDRDLFLIGSSDCLDWEKYLGQLTFSHMKYSPIQFETLDAVNAYVYTYTSLALQSIHLNLLFYPVTLNQITYGYVVLALDLDASYPDILETQKIQQLGLFVALQLTKQNEFTNATRRCNGLLMDELINMKTPTFQQIEHLLTPLEKKIHKKYYAMQLQYKDSADVNAFLKTNNRLGVFHMRIKHDVDEFSHILVFEKSNAQIFLIPSQMKHMDSLVFQIKELFIRTTGIEDICIGISEMTDITNIRQAFRQCSQIASYLHFTNAGQRIFHYEQMGILRYFIGNEGDVNKELLLSIQDQYILPLECYDREHDSHLLETLDTYIKYDCSKTETAEKLFIHKNTLRFRINTINKLTGCNIDSAEGRFNIQLALKLKYLFESSGVLSGEQ